MFWDPAAGGCVQCTLCPHNCLIAENSSGFCGSRVNSASALIAEGYGLVSSLALDPIEKKPLRMFHPGSRILSAGGFGCNLRCPFCQNHGISVPDASSLSSAKRMTPGDVLALAVQTIPEGNIGVAYTYNEPFINYEFLLSCAELTHDAGLKNVVVTNGYINARPLERALSLIDAMNIDLKGFTEGFYGRLKGKLGPVMETIALARKHCHVEVTTLVLPGENEDDISELAGWLSSLSPDIPLHLSRFFPRHKYSGKSPTPRETIYRLQETAKQRLNYVFTGNM